jgi:glucan phosphoethanolaminetransferase (alkaline phosphatase superfamily)
MSKHEGHHDHQHQENNTNAMAISATLHCLTGCAIGEVLGLIIGTIFGLSVGTTIILAITLAFVFGFGLSTLPLLKAGIGFTAALSVVAAADTLSITTMELVDNLVMVGIPGAMEASLVDPLFWISMPIALTAAFFVALPVNKYLLKRNKGHALTMKLLGEHGHDHSH